MLHNVDSNDSCIRESFLKGQCHEILLYIAGKIICELSVKWAKKSHSYRSSTGQAHNIILEWQTNGMDTAAIFHNLLLNYDKRLTAEDARNQLIGYKVQVHIDVGE